MRYLVLVGCVALSACVNHNAPNHAVNNGQATDFITYADGSGPSGLAGVSVHANPGPTSHAIVNSTCPAGATLVVTPEGHRSCAHTSAANVQVGSTSALDADLNKDLQAEATAIGRPVAYSDGIHTVTITPAPTK